MDQLDPLLKEIDASTVNTIQGRVEHLIREDAIQDLYKDTVQVVGAFFAQETYTMVKKAMGDTWIRKDAPIPTSAQFQERIWGQLYRSAGERITAITGESKRQAVNIIQSTLAQINMETQPPGASMTAMLLRDRLREDWGPISTYRAARIARTEVAAASNLGSITGARESNEPMLKVWLSTRDTRTRRRRGAGTFDHYGTYPNGPDGEKVEMDAKFQKTGEPLDYPCDYSGDAANVIHCRCSVYYEPKVVDTAATTATPRPPQPPEPPPPPPVNPGGGPAVSVEARMKKIKDKAVNMKGTKNYEAMMDAHEEAGKFLDEANKKAKEINDLARQINVAIVRGNPSDSLRAMRLELINKRKAILKEYHRKEFDIWDAQNNMLEEFADIMDMREGSNVSYQMTSNNAGAIKKRAAGLFERIMGQVGATGEINISSTVYTKRGRAECSGTRVKLYSDSGPATVCHEAGHAIEHSIDQLHDDVIAFMKERIGWHEKTISYHGEGCWEDNWLNPYTGKYYPTGWGSSSLNATFEYANIRRGSSEVFSMWWTEFIENPYRFALEDPEHFNWGLEMIFKLQGK